MSQDLADVRIVYGIRYGLADCLYAFGEAHHRIVDSRLNLEGSCIG